MGHVMRLYNWETRLALYITRVAREGFAWGRHDCAVFAAGGVEAVTGTDPAAAWRERYDSLATGLRLIRAAGYADHVAAADAMYPAISPAMILPGDLAVVAGEDGARALGIAQGQLIYVLRPDCLGLVPVDQALRLLGVR